MDELEVTGAVDVDALDLPAVDVLERALTGDVRPVVEPVVLPCELHATISSSSMQVVAATVTAYLAILPFPFSVSPLGV